MALPTMRFAALAGLLLAVAQAAPADAGSAASDWILGHNSRVRLIAAPVKYPDGSEKLTAGVEIALDPGWKTYWRSPGDAGGVPPEFDWKKSANLASATVLFPAPSRLTDPLGESIGYKHSVLFPVTVGARDAAKPVTLDVALTYGVCAKICIPEEHELTLSFDPAAATDPDILDRLTRALATVPMAADTSKNAPRLAGLKLETAGGKPSVLIDTQFPSGASDAELFAEALDNSFVPMPDRLADSGDGHVRFRIDLTKSDDLKQPSGKKLRLTLVGDDAASETMTAIP